MPLFTDNFVVAGVKEDAPPATTPREAKETVSFVDLRKQAAQSKRVVFKEQPTNNDHHKYHKVEDGELIRHISKKSQYHKDIFEDF